MNDVRPRAKVTFTDAVGDMNIGKWPIRLETRINTAKVATTGKCLKPLSPIMLEPCLIARNPPQASTGPVWVLRKLSFQKIHYKYGQMHAIKNIIVPRYCILCRIRPEHASGVVPNFQTGCPDRPGICHLELRTAHRDSGL